MVRVKVRHLVAKRLKSGRVLYYWQPPAALRGQGFQPRRLADDMAAAIAEAERLNFEVDAWRRGEEPVPFAPETIPWLVRLYAASDRYTDLKPSTQRGYRQCLDRIEAWSERANHPPLESIERRHVFAFKRSMGDAPAMANAVIRVLRLLLQYAHDEGYLDENPAQKVRLRGRPPRQQVWAGEQIAAFLKAATEDGHPSLALAVRLAADLGQREGDILRLVWSQFVGSAFEIKQGKTQADLIVPATVELRAALDATPRLSPTIVIAEATGRPYKADHFRHEFRRIANLAGIPGDLQFLDLRRTAVVRLAEAGCTVPEVAAISGHSLERTQSILETYLPRTTPMAQAAISKLELYRKRTKLEG